MTQQLIREVFLHHFNNEWLCGLSDSAMLSNGSGRTVFTTDSFVVDPLFFPGGDIGKLAVCGTVNDLAVTGAIPAYLSAGFILEEGLTLETLHRIAASMAEEARHAGVQIVTGDTKVVHRGKADGVFINTSGIGFLPAGRADLSNTAGIRPGDRIIVNGHLGEHGVAVLSAREELEVASQVHSDCASLNALIDQMCQVSGKIRFMRDLTRGGLATVLCEVTDHADFGLYLLEDKMPVGEAVRGICEMLGMDPLYMANEGKLVAIVDPADADDLLGAMHEHPLGANAQVIGQVAGQHPGQVVMETQVGGRRIIEPLTGEQLPRIC